MFGNSGKARVPSSDDLIATPSAGPTSATAAAAAGAGAGAGAADDNNKIMIELARKGKLSQLKDIVATGGVNINYVDAAFGWSALAHATGEGHLDCVKFLLASGANPNMADRMGSTALHRAAFKGHNDIAKELLNAGADPTIVDFTQQSPQQVAVQSNNWRLASKLNKAESKVDKSKVGEDKGKMSENDVRRHQQKAKQVEEEKKKAQEREKRSQTVKKSNMPSFPMSFQGTESSSHSKKVTSADAGGSSSAASAPDHDETGDVVRTIVPLKDNKKAKSQTMPRRILSLLGRKTDDDE